MVHVGYRLNPPPGWPPVPEGFVPPPGWRPDPSWPAPPPGWQLWLPDDSSPAPVTTPPGPPADGAPASPASPVSPPFAPPGSSTTPTPYPSVPAAGHGTGFGYGAGPAYAAGPAYGAEGAAPNGAGAPYPYGAGYPPPNQQPMSGLAIASFVLGLIGLFLLTAVLSVILGIVALAEIRRNGQRGRGLAIAGIAVSGVWLVAVIGLIVLGATSGGGSGTGTGAAARASNPASKPSHQASVNVFSLAVGTCFDNPAGQEFSINSVTAISCSQAHNAQVFAEFNTTGTSFPGTAALERRADNGCNARISGNLNQSKITSSMSLHFIFPRQLAWDSGQRRISCLIENSSRDLRSSLLLKAGSG